jgi:hypothetical protein
MRSVLWEIILEAGRARVRGLLAFARARSYQMKVEAWCIMWVAWLPWGIRTVTASLKEKSAM